MMFDHIGIKVSDLPTSAGFYRSALDANNIEAVCLKEEG
jgi:catechol 2,3-dioxygenase-like lactoylglutathione lyase family enzyme